MATVGFAILLVAINLAVARVALLAADTETWPHFVLFLLPMIDILLVGGYRLRRRDRRTAATLGFLLAGSVGTLVVLGLCILAPEAAWDFFNANLTAVFHGLARTLGNAVMRSGPVDVILGIGLEFPLPMIFFCAPPLAIACLGGWLGRRLGTVNARVGAQAA
jgi:hypothetical protein